MTPLYPSWLWELHPCFNTGRPFRSPSFVAIGVSGAMKQGLQLAMLPAVWLAPNIYCETPHSRWIMGSRGRWELPPFAQAHWQSPCTALTAGKRLPLGLCKETVNESTVPAITRHGKSNQRELFARRSVWTPVIYVLTITSKRLYPGDNSTSLPLTKPFAKYASCHTFIDVPSRNDFGESHCRDPVTSIMMLIA